MFKYILLSTFLVLTSCGPLGNAFTNLLSDGPSLNANVQAGKTNTQTVGSTQVEDNRIVKPQADTIQQDNSQTTNQELPPWLWLAGLFLFIVGWATDTPRTMLSRNKT